MSDSDNEFGSLAPTTPLVPIKKGSRKNKVVAGPSKARGRSKAAKTSPESSEIEEIRKPNFVDVSSEHDEEVVQTELPKKTKGKAPATRSEDVVMNGNTTTRGKGKGKMKADPKPQPPRKVAKPVNTTVPEYHDLVEDTDGESVAPRGVQGSNASRRSRNTETTFTEPSRNERELERLRQTLHDVESQRNALSHQLEELFRVRNTDAEQILEQQTLQYEARLQTQEALIKELTAQAARVEPLTRSGKSSVLYLLTREAADEEKRAVERDLARLKDIMKEKDATIAENDKRIAELQRNLQDARSELKAEIERSKTLASNPSRKTPAFPQGRSQGTILGNDNPKNTEVIKLYEDLTNLLVPVLRFSTGNYFHLSEANFTCIYTFVPRSEDEGKAKSLSFILRLYHDKSDPNDPDPVSQSDLQEMVQYTPLELDKESFEFVKKLDYLGDSFNFTRDQLPLFLGSIQSNMANASKDVDANKHEKMDVE